MVKCGPDHYNDYKKYVYAATHKKAVAGHLLPLHPTLDSIHRAAQCANTGTLLVGELFLRFIVLFF